MLAKELERAIYNWYLTGENANPEPIFNVLADGYENELQMLVPIETPNIMLQLMGNPENLKPGDTFTAGEDIGISFRHLVVNEDGGYFIPLFTCQEEIDRGEPTSVINQPIKALFDVADSWTKCLGFVINPWGQQFVLEKDIIHMLKEYERRAFISIIRGSVLDAHVAAIVNAANTSLLGGGGVDGAIHRAAGPKLLEECRRLHGCRTGEAKSTGAYNITTADNIIHTAGPIYSGTPEDSRQLAACYLNSLEQSFENGNDSIVFPCISTGVYGYPIEEAAYIALTAIAQWLEEHEGILKNVYICCYRDEEYEAYRRLVERGDNGVR
ncbi:MAG: macro domain-containing protein [Lachnospiraceae bacterium]|nr:macro domain-containing protein [Lachnospiraceae bacterium]